MKFSTKVFLAVFLPALGLLLAASTVLYTYLSTSTRAQFIAHYQSVTHQVGQTLTQLESTTDLLMSSAVQVLRERVHQSGPLANDELRKLRTELGVSHLYIVNKEGAFIRATSEDPQSMTNAFTFCSRYRRMFEEGAPFVPTGLMPGIPALIPHKFLFLASYDRQYLLEVGVRADFIGQTLRQTLTADTELISLALYAPNGASLGEFAADGSFSYERSLGPSIAFTEGTKPTPGRLQVTERVAASNKECCSCRKRGLIADGDYHYYLRAVVSTRALDLALRRISWSTSVLVAVGIGFSLLLSRWLSRRLVARIERINEKAQVIMRTGDLGQRLNLHEENDEDEVGRLSAQIDEMLAALQVKQAELIRLEKTRALVEATEHVVHDIRSPLAVLDTLLKLNPAVAEEQRTLLRTAANRIRDISNNLREEGRRLRGAASESDAAESNGPAKPRVVAEPESAWLMLESVVAEKRHQYRDRPGLILELLHPEQAYPVFVSVDESLFRRTLSNLIDNAVEAIAGAGQVWISAMPVAGRVHIEVADTGCGIPSEILPTLMEKGRTYGKAAGSGLGLYAARQALAAWGGELRLQSEVGRGTTVTAVLAMAEPPGWFLSVLRVLPEATVVVVDDVDSIHEVWRARFAAWSTGKDAVRLVHHRTLAELRRFVATYSASTGPLLVLIDQELSGTSETGLDCIAELGLMGSSVLVTGRADEREVRRLCGELGVKLLAKGAAGFVRIDVALPE